MLVFLNKYQIIPVTIKISEYFRKYYISKFWWKKNLIFKKTTLITFCKKSTITYESHLELLSL